MMKLGSVTPQSLLWENIEGQNLWCHKSGLPCAWLQPNLDFRGSRVQDARACSAAGVRLPGTASGCLSNVSEPAGEEGRCLPIRDRACTRTEEMSRSLPSCVAQGRALDGAVAGE